MARYLCVRFVRGLVLTARGRLALTGFLSVLVAAGCLTAVYVPVAAAAPASPSAGILYAWGSNNSGQLGDNSGSDSSTPIAVSLPGGAAATAVSEGAWTTLALDSDGNVYAWGYNIDGQLGDGTTTDSWTPVRVSLPAGVTATGVSEGQDTSLALGSDGNVYAWGDNTAGQLGDGSTTSSSTPVRVSLPGGVTATAVSEGDGTSLALGSDGNVYAWGFTADADIHGSSIDFGAASATPVQVSLPGGVTATAISAGIYTCLALGSDGNVYAWGDDSYGQLGNGSLGLQGHPSVPAQVPLPDGVTATAVSEGDGTSLAVGSDGNVYAWGSNGYGTLGDGSTATAYSTTPVQVSLPGGVGATTVSAGENTSLAVGSDGNVYAWGYNLSGELGDGTTNDSSTPVKVPLPGGAVTTAVSEGYGASMAIGRGGTVVPVSTSTTLTASPNPAMTGAPVMLTVREIAANGAYPGGTVQLEVGGTITGPPVAVNGLGAVSITTTFASAGPESLSVEFTPTDSAGFSSSFATLTLPVIATYSGTIPLAAVDPSSGAFTLTVDTADTVTLTMSKSGTSASAMTTPVTVSDTRNTFPGWSVSGQDSDWTGSGTAAGATISGNQLGWTPTNTDALPPGVTLGPSVTPASPGLGSTPAVLASQHAGTLNGYGTATLGANLTLLIPAPQPAGPYSSGLTITAVTSAP